MNCGHHYVTDAAKVRAETPAEREKSAGEAQACSGGDKPAEEYPAGNPIKGFFYDA
jgi:hypothetical protein